MGRFIVKRLILMIPIMLGIAILIFTIMYFCPGNPAALMLGVGATQIEIAQKRAELGLDQPYIVQLLKFLKQVFVDFDLGTSYFYGTPVIDGIIARMHYTLIIALSCMGLQIIIGTPLGIIAATHRNGFADRFCMIVALAGVSIPGFWLALMMVILFAVNLGWLPAYGVGGIQYFIMPCIANCFAGVATQARQTRSSMLEVIRSDFITTARAKGLTEREILFRHALPNALIPIITIIGNGMGMMLGGAVVIENVFSIPGIGNYMMNSINSRDYPIVMGGVLVLGIIFCFIMLLVDIVYAFVDPRIKARYEVRRKKVKMNVS